MTQYFLYENINLGKVNFSIVNINSYVTLEADKEYLVDGKVIKSCLFTSNIRDDIEISHLQCFICKSEIKFHDTVTIVRTLSGFDIYFTNENDIMAFDRFIITNKLKGD